MDTVTVVIPTYNGKKTLRSTVESVVSQTYPKLEIIVVDDGSSDGTEKCIKDYIKQGKIRFLRQNNRGIAAARNTGLRACSSEYIALLDHDDLWDADKVEKQVNFIEKERIDFVFCLMRWQRLNGDVDFPPMGSCEESKIIEKLLQQCAIASSTTLFRKKILDKAGLLDENFRYCEDWDWWIRIASCCRVACLPQYLVTRRDQSTSFSITYTGKYAYYVRLYEKNKKLISRDERKIFRSNIGNKCYTDAVKLVKGGHISKAFSAYGQAIRMRWRVLFRFHKLLGMLIRRNRLT